MTTPFKDGWPKVATSSITQLLGLNLGTLFEGGGLLRLYKLLGVRYINFLERNSNDYLLVGSHY